jgi:hypothetical protein
MSQRPPLDKAFGIGTPPAGLTRTNKGRFLGRVTIDVWEGDAKGDGIEYTVHHASSNDLRVIDEFARSTIERFGARLLRQQRPG